MLNLSVSSNFLAPAHLVAWQLTLFDLLSHVVVAVLHLLLVLVEQP